MLGNVTCDIRDYQSGELIGEAAVRETTFDRYEQQEIAQWPEGTIRAGDLLSEAEMERLNIGPDRIVWIDITYTD